MRTIEEDRLIAEFMGMTSHENMTETMVYNTNGINDIINLDELRYSTSWDALMPVVQTIKDNDKDDPGYNYIDAIDFSLMDGSLDGVYETVVLFIKWYNKNK